MARKNHPYKISIFSEFSALSALVIGLMVIFTLVSLALTVWMVIPPPKEARLEDEAGIFTQEESQELLEAMKSIRSENEISVIVVTVSDKGTHYMKKDETGSIRYAQDRYTKLAHFEKFRDNSGVLILLDLDGEYRYFDIITFGTARTSITDAECRSIILSQQDLLEEKLYSDAVSNTLRQIDNHEFESPLLILTYASFIIIPIAITAIVIGSVLNRHRSKKEQDDIDTYLDQRSLTSLKGTDNFERTVSEKLKARPEMVMILFLRSFMRGIGGGGEDD